MTWGMVAVAGASIVGGAISANASKKAANKASDAADRSASQIADAAKVARNDVMTQFPQAQQDLMAGAGGAFNLFNQSMRGQQNAVSQGNMNAQNTVGQGFGNIQNALLGLPVNQELYQAKGIAPTANSSNPFGQFQGGFTNLQNLRDAENVRQMSMEEEAVKRGGGGGGFSVFNPPGSKFVPGHDKVVGSAKKILKKLF